MSRPIGTHRRLAVAAGLAAGALALAACASGGSGSGDSTASTASDAPTDAAASPAATAAAPSGADLSGEVTVFAAASLTGVFTELGDELMAANPDLTVTFSFAASSALAEQVTAGAPADVLATASRTTMDQVGDLAVDPVTFATNTLVIVTPADNPGNVTGLADFANPDLRIAVCAEEVPCGAAAAKVFTATGITPSVDTYAENVTAALTLVTTGEVDAALVYATDALSAADSVVTIEFPQAGEAVNANLVATLEEAPNPEAAQAFVDLVLSPQGTKVLEAAGFGGP